LNIEGGADLTFPEVPLMDGVRELAERDLFPGGSRRNYEAYRDQVDWGRLGEVDKLILCDAQTSGGLLAALPPERAAAFASAVPGAARIGVINGRGTIRVLS
jgi:selenide, water dikinase